MGLLKDALKSLFSHKKAIVFSLVIGLAVSLFADNYRWVGGTDNLWETLDNWEVYDETIPDWVAATALPGESDEVDLQTNTVETLLAAVSVSKITGSTGSSLTFNGTGDQSLTLAADSTIPSLIFSGTGDQSIVTAGDLTVGTLNLSKSSGGGFSTSGAGKITVSTGFYIELDSAESVVLGNEFDITGFNLVQAKSTVLNKNVVVAADAIADTSTSGNLEFNAGGTVNATQILVSGNIIISGTEAVSFPNGVQLDSPVQIKDTASIETTDFTVNSTLSLAAAGTSVTATGDVLVNSTGTVTNKGTLSADGAITNKGSLSLTAGASLTTADVFLNDSTGTFTNKGTLSADGTITNSAGTITNSTGGTISTDSDFLNDAGTLTNTGTTTVGGLFDNTDGSLTNNGTLTVTNLFDNHSGTLINPGTLSIGTKYSSNGGTLQNSGSLTTTDDFENSYGSTTNTGTITVGGNFDNTSSGSLANSNLLYVAGDFDDTDGTVTGTGSIIFNGTSQSFTPNTGTTYAKITSSSSSKLSVLDNLTVTSLTHSAGDIEFAGKLNLGNDVTFTNDVILNKDLTSSAKVSFESVTVNDSLKISGTQISVDSSGSITGSSAGKNLTLAASSGTFNIAEIGSSTTKFGTVTLDSGSSNLTVTSGNVHSDNLVLKTSGNITATGLSYDGELALETSGIVNLNGGTGGLSVGKLTFTTTPSSIKTSGIITVSDTSGISFPTAITLSGDTVLDASGTGAPVDLTNGASGSYSLEVKHKGVLTLGDSTSATDTENPDISVSSFIQNGNANVSIAGDINASNTISFNTTALNLTGDVKLSGSSVTLSSAVTVASSSSYALTVDGTLIASAAVTANADVYALNSVTANAGWGGSKSLIFNGSGNQSLVAPDDITMAKILVQKTSGNFSTTGSGELTFTSFESDSAQTSTITFNNESTFASLKLTKEKGVVFNKAVTITSLDINDSTSGTIDFNGGGTVDENVIKAEGKVTVSGATALTFTNGLTAQSPFEVSGELDTTVLNVDGTTYTNSGTTVLSSDLVSTGTITNTGLIKIAGNFNDSTGTYSGNGTLHFNGATQIFTPNASTTYTNLKADSSSKLTVNNNAKIANLNHVKGNIEFTKPFILTTAYSGTSNTGTLTFDDTVTTSCAAAFVNTGLTTFEGAATFGGNVSFAGDVKLSEDLTSSGTIGFQNLEVTSDTEISGTQITAASGKTISTTATSGTVNLTLKASGGTISAGKIGTSSNKFNIVELDTGSHDIDFTSETIYANQIKFTSSGNVTVTGINYDGDLIFNTSGKVSINGGTGGFKVKNIVLQTTPSSFELSGNIEITGTGGISFPKAVVLTGNTVLTASGTNAPVTFSSGISGAYTLVVNNAGLLTIDDKTSLTDTSNADVNITSFTQSGAGAVSIAGDITCSSSIKFETTSFTLTGNVLLYGSAVILTKAITLSSSSSYELSVSGKLQAYEAVTANVNVNALNDVVSNGNWAGSKSLIFAGSNNQIFNPQTGTTYSSVYIIKTDGTFTCARANADNGTTAVTFADINIDSASPTITFGFDKGLKITGTIDIDDSKAVVFNNTVTIATMTADKSDSLTFNGPTTITTVSVDNNGSTTFNGTATIATISIDNNGTTTFNDTATITTFNVDKNTSTTFNGTTTITNISDTTDSGTFTFNNGVTFSNNVTLNTTKLVTFKETSNIGAASSRKNFTHTGGVTNINGTFNANDVSLGAMTSTQELTINADDISVNGTTTTAAKFTVNATTLTFFGTITTAEIVELNCNTVISGNITWTNSNYIKTATGKSISCTGNFTQGTGTGTNNKSFMLGGSFTASGSATFTSDVFYYGNTTSSFGSTGTGSFTLAGNFLVGLNGSGAINVISNVSAKNYVCLAGTVNLSAGKFLSSTTGDVVIVGANAIFEDSTVTNSIYEYDYTGSRGSSATSPSTPQYTMDTTFPDGTNGGMFSTGFAGKMTFGSGAVLHAGQNFYANGTTLTGSATWYIDIKKTSDSESAFAECYDTSVTNCTVRKHAGNAFTAGAESEDTQMMWDSIGNDPNEYPCPTYTLTNCKNFDNTVFEIKNAYTVRDNVIRVEFSHPVRNYNGELNGKKNGSSTVTTTLNRLSNIKFKANNGSDTAFSEVYLDEECTTPLTGDLTQSEGTGANTVYYCYIKAPSTWATDATGASPGVSGSTDRYGNVRNTAIPYIQIPRATNTLKFVVTDIYGKRLRNYKNYTAVQDKTAPALVAVSTGQENHEDEAANQWSYDGHNYIEFRYSEEVNFNKTDGTSITNLTISNVNTTDPSNSKWQNILVSQNLGGITQTMTSDYEAGVSVEGITFKGLGKTAAGYISTGKNGTRTTPSANQVNSLYRKDNFSVRISIAGYTDGTVTGGFRKWVGYIESAKIPSGQITQEYTDTEALTGHTGENIYINKCVIDKNGNYLKIYNTNIDKTGTGGTPANVNKVVTVTNGRWDLSSPEFAKVHKMNQTNPETYFEAVGMGAGTVLDRVEIHLTDNTGGDNFTDGSPIGNWITSFGWSTDYGASLASSNTYCADIFGGSRPYAGGTSYTKGGIRYCTILNQQTNFQYCVGTGAGMVPTTQFSNILPGGTAPIFIGASATRRDVPTTKDNTYIQFYLASSDNNLAYDTTFTITYDAANSYITDLAGNRLRSISLSVTNMESIDRTPPTFDLVIAPVGSDEIYIQFVKQLTKQIVYQANTAENAGYISNTFEEIIPYCFEIGKINPTTHEFESSGTTLQIDRSSPASIIDSHSNTSFTAVRLKLNRTITLDDVEHLYIRVTSAKDYPGGAYEERSKDPFTSIANSYVTFIQDSIGNYMQMYSAHCLSDFAVNVVFPSYAYDPDFVNENGDLIQDGLYKEGSYAVHEWGQNQGNYGTLKAKDPVILLADVTDGTPAGEAANVLYETPGTPLKLKMYISSSPTPMSQSTQYNIDLSKSLRVWVPGTIPLYGLSGVTNSNTDTLYGVWDTTEGGITFTIPEPLYSSWSSGNQITFLFGLEDNSGTPLTIFHTPVLNVSSGTFTYSEINPAPLYALRLSNPDDITSIDLWSFRVKDITPQRGGITIMNNVIDPTVGEKMVLNVNMKSEGDLSIIVMTLDGNVVTYLNRGSLSAGEYYFTWDGKNKKGDIVARGIYFIRIIGNGVDETRKVMIIKE
jgi:formylmethanofuran dehydrogenase subunit C